MAKSTKIDNKGIFTVLGILGLGWILSRGSGSGSGGSGSGGSFPGGSMSDPRGIRNNNPGNIKYNSANNWLGKIPGPQNTDPGRTFEQFTDLKYGLRAMLILLKKYYINDNLKTIKGIINKWDPGSTSSGSGYVPYISDRMDLDPTDLLDLSDLKDLAVHISSFENGTKVTSPGEIQDIVDQFNLQI